METNIKVIEEQNSLNFDIPRESEICSISVDDCRKILDKYELTDEQLSLIKNSIIGIADSIISNYIDEYL